MTPTPVASPPRGTEASYAQLRALAVADAEGWCHYLAGKPAEGRHIVELARPRHATTYRTLVRGEAFWWSLGLADGAGWGQRVDAVLGEPVPALISTTDAARAMPAVDRWGNRTGPWMSEEGIKYNITSTRLYPLYGEQRRRYLFVAQVDAERAARDVEQLDRLVALAAREDNTRAVRTHSAQLEEALPIAEQARATWLELRQLLPPNTPPDALAVDTRPLPSPDPLPIRAPGAGGREVQALRVGDSRGWFTYEHPVEGGGYLVTVADVESKTGQVQREIPVDGVLPWVLGVADWNNAAGRVAYRQGLGG